MKLPQKTEAERSIIREKAKEVKDMKQGVKVLATVLVLLLLMAATLGCSSGKALMTVDGNDMSVNLYELMLSIQKGNMAYMINHWYGDVNSEEFWGTVIDESSTTYDDYYTAAVYKKAQNLLAAVALFEEMGLSLPAATEKKLDADIDALIEEHGSKKALNTALSAYNVNVDMYREYKLMEAKSAYLAETLYGTGGSKIGAMLKEQYLAEHYVAFRQILIANYYYVYETDKNGDTVYYTDSGKVAYDTKKGTPKLENGTFVYYTEDGKIAYDTVTGKPAPVLDDHGQQKTAAYSKEEMLERADLAVELRDMAGDSEAVFDSLRTMYSDEADEDGGHCYLATNVDYTSIGVGFMDDIADALATLEVGETAIVSSDYGYHVVRRYANESGAYADKANSQWFTDSTYGVYDFMNNLENDLFLKRIADHVARIETDDELLASVTLKQVAPNYNYR